MSSKKPQSNVHSTPKSNSTAGVKRATPSSAATPSTAAAAKKKAKIESTPNKKINKHTAANDEDSDDDNAIFALKAQLSAKKSVAPASLPVAAAAAPVEEEEEEEFEVAANDDDDDEAPKAYQPPSEEDDDDEDDDAAMSDVATPAPVVSQPIKKSSVAPTPLAAKATPAKPTPASVSTPAKSAPSKPAPSAKPTPAKPTPSQPTPAKPATAAAVPTPAKTAPAATLAKKTAAAAKEESESSESEDEEEEKEVKKPAQPAAQKSSAATPLPSKPTPAPPAAAAAAAVSKPLVAASKPVVSSVGLDDSSESDDDDDETSAAARLLAERKKLATTRKATPLVGDASVNPPPKPVKATPLPTPSTTFNQPLTRPPTAAHTGRSFTVSIAVPGSIISNAQSKELRTYVAGQIARACATFNVDEIVVFAEQAKQQSGGVSGNFEGATRSTDPDIFMVRILQYLETPQYLRKQLFPKHNDLALAGLLNPLDSPHHVRIDEEVAYREGVVVNRPVSQKKGKIGDDGSTVSAGGSWANIGLKTEALLDRTIDVGTRVTVHIPQVAGSTARKTVHGKAVAPATPREKNGTYWGYTTRLANSLSAVWSECPFKGGYDLSIGTSEHGSDCHSPSFTLPPFRHVILFFGGLAGLEEHIAADESINVKRPEQLFQMYINSVIGQGCRTIRTEEAVPITLAALYRHIRTNQPPVISTE